MEPTRWPTDSAEEAESGDVLAAFAGHTNRVRDVVFSGDGSRMVTGSADGTAVLWDVNGPTLVRRFEGHERSVVAVDLAPDGELLATGSFDGTVRIWDAVAGELLHVLDMKAPVSDVAFRPGGAAVAAVAGHRLRVWHARTGKRIDKIRLDRDASCLAYDADGLRIAVGSTYDEPGLAGRTTVDVFDGSTTERIATLQGHRGPVRAVRFSEDGVRLFAASEYGATLTWNLEESAPVITKGPRVRDDRPAVNELARVTVDAEDADPLARLHVTIGFGDGTVEGDDNTLHAWTEPGVYRVCATVDDGLTRVLGVKEVEVGKPRRLIPKLKAKLDLDDAGRDKLDLRLRMPVDLPVGTDLAGMLLEVDVVASNDDSVIAVATAVTLDVSGRGEADGAMVSLRHRSDLWKLKLKLRRQDFETAEGPREDSAWNFRDEDHPVPATIRVRLDGAMLWTTTVELRYDSKRNRKGKLR